MTPSYPVQDRATASRRQLESAAHRIENAVTAASLPLGRYAERIDCAQAVLARDTAEALRRALVEQRANVKHALERLGDGAYGTCEDCGQPIDPERLRVLPEATRCIACQRLRNDGSR